MHYLLHILGLTGSAAILILLLVIVTSRFDKSP
jgi:uncharacterized membrane protein